MTNFWTQLAQLWRLERLTTRQRFEDARNSSTVKNRVDAGNALAALEIDEMSASSGDRVTLWLTGPGGGFDAFRGGPGTPVRLWHDAPDRDFLQGVVSRRSGTRLAVVVDGFPPDRFFDVAFQLDVEAPETTFDRGDRAIRHFTALKTRDDIFPLSQCLLGVKAPSLRRDATVWTPLDPHLHARQREAIQRALDATELALIHGPPGTGKTRTLVEYVRQEVVRGHRLLVTAGSNVAVDTLAERLLACGIELVRLGHPARVLGSVEAATLDAKMMARPDAKLARGWQDEATRLFRKARTVSRAQRRELIAQARALNGDARRHLSGIEDAILSAAQVVCATAAGADSAILRDKTFDVCVVDEASQTPDPMTLVAAKRAPKLVMAGDPRQLPPTVIDPKAEADGLGSTFFERLEGHSVMLVEQHRMHQTIMGFSSAQFYGNELVAAAEVRTHRLEDLGVTPDPLRDNAMVFVDTAGKGFDEVRGEGDMSVANPGQGQRVAAEVLRLMSRGLHAHAIGVITPYDAQARLLRRLLEVDGLEIGTVDGFQGREKEAIVVDLVRSNETGEVGFLSDARRLNVAITRARRFVLVVGDSATLGGHRLYEALFGWVEAHGLWISAWSDDAEAFQDS